MFISQPLTFDNVQCLMCYLQGIHRINHSFGILLCCLQHQKVFMIMWLGSVNKYLLLNLTDFVWKQKPPHPPVLNGQYQNGQNTKQNKMKNTCHFYIVFQVLKVLLIKICKIQPPRSFISCCFYQLGTSGDIIFHTDFQDFI